jgi:protein O-mannosyl-transferase
MTSVASPALEQATQLRLTPYKQAIGLTVVLLVATIALYFPVIHHPFANIDDQGYVAENLHVQNGLRWSTFTWAITTFDDSNWHPLTWISHAMDCQIFGIDPAGHHAMNMVWHAIDVAVLFWVLLFATGFVGRSFMVAALFALHPINVEAVAWVAERKTMLSTLFFLLALGAYRWYARRPSNPRYLAVAGLFVLGLMAKPQIITLPFVLLLWDYWPLGRMFPGAPSAGEIGLSVSYPPRTFVTLVKEKIPLLMIAMADALITMKAQHVGHPAAWPYSIWIRLGNAFVAYVRYLGKGIWPSNLAIMYLHPGNSLKLWQVALSAVLLIVVTVLVLVYRRYRYLPVGWFWFLGTMIPTIGLMQVGRQAMADRYAYQSFLGLFFIVCWGISDWARQKQLPKAALPAVSVAVLLVLSGLTYRQISYWTDNLTLWSHALDATGNNWMAHDMTAALLLASGHRDEAIVHYRAVLINNPTDPGVNLFLALDDQKHGNNREAIGFYQNALKGMDDPLERAKAYQNMAIAYRSLGDSTHADESARKAAKLRSIAAK